MRFSEVIVVGVGGIGGALCAPLCRYLQFSTDPEDSVPIVLIDGDQYEQKNMARQNCGWTDLFKNKAEAEAEKLSQEFDSLDLQAFPHYVTDENVSTVIHEGSLVFLGLDNMKSRAQIAEFCDTLENVTVVSGGNELTDGNVQVFIKRDGVRLTANLHEYHPEIAAPADKNPQELGCLVAAQSAPQIYFMNMQIAVLMLATLHNLLSLSDDADLSQVYGEVYTDITEFRTAPVMRPSIGDVPFDIKKTEKAEPKSAQA